MADTIKTVPPDSTTMESNGNPVNKNVGNGSSNNIRQRVPLKKDKPTPRRAYGYVSPFLADKARIEAKFVNLQCVWRDLEQQRQIGKKTFKERDFDHKPREKIKHKENYLTQILPVKQSLKSPEIQSGVGQLLLLEKKLDENDNELPTPKPVEYTNVIHKRDNEPIESIFAIGNVDNKKASSVLSKPLPWSTTPVSNVGSITKTAAGKEAAPLKLGTRSLRVRPASTSSQVGVSSEAAKLNTASTIKRVTLTKPNSPNRLARPHSIATDVRWRTNEYQNPRTLGERFDSNYGTTNQLTSNKLFETEGSIESRSTSNSESGYESSRCNERKTSSVEINLISPRLSETPHLPNPFDDTHEDGPSSIDEHSSQERPVKLDSSKNSGFGRDGFKTMAEKQILVTKENSMNSEKVALSDRSKTQEDVSQVDLEGSTSPVRAHILKDSHSDPKKIRSTNGEFVQRNLSVNGRRYDDRKANETGRSLRGFDATRNIFEKSEPNFSTVDENSNFEKLESAGSQKKNLATKLQNIQTNIHKIVTDIKQSKQATGHVKPDDELSQNTMELNTPSVAMEHSDLKSLPKAEKSQTSNTTQKCLDKQHKVQKGVETSAQKTSANAFELGGSKSLETSPLDTVTFDSNGVDGKKQTLNGTKVSHCKLSDSGETEKLTVMNTKRVRKTSERRHRNGSTSGHKNNSFINGDIHRRFPIDLKGLTNDGDNETSHEVVPLKGGGQRRIMRHKSSKGSGQDPEEVATDLQKALLTTKKVIEKQLTGILDKKIESDNLVGALKRSMTKPTAREKVMAATNEIHEIIQNGVIQEENGKRIYQVRVQMGSFVGDINYSQDGYVVIIEGSTTESPIFTKEIRVEFPTQDLDIELLSVHTVGAVVELNVPYLHVPESREKVKDVLNQYISDEVYALKREYMLPWLDNGSVSSSNTPPATVTENALVLAPSSVSKYMTEDDMKQAKELEINPGEKTKNVTVTDLDSPKSPKRYVNLPPRPPPQFAPPLPPKNGLETEEDTFLINRAEVTRPRRIRRYSSRLSNGSVSNDCDRLNSNNNNVYKHDVINGAQSPGDTNEVFFNGSNLVSKPRVTKPRRSRRSRNSSIVSTTTDEIGHSLNGN